MSLGNIPLKWRVLIGKWSRVFLADISIIYSLTASSTVHNQDKTKQYSRVVPSGSNDLNAQCLESSGVVVQSSSGILVVLNTFESWYFRRAIRLRDLQV